MKYLDAVERRHKVADWSNIRNDVPRLVGLWNDAVPILKARGAICEGFHVDYMRGCLGCESRRILRDLDTP